MTLRGVPVLQYDGARDFAPSPRSTLAWRTTGSRRFRWARQLVSIREHGYRVVRLSRRVGPARGGRAPGRRSAVVLTFDDGRAATTTWRSRFFSPQGCGPSSSSTPPASGQPGYLTWARIAEMHRAGMSFQSHAHDHVALPVLSAPAPQKRAADLQASHRRLPRAGRGLPGRSHSLARSARRRRRHGRRLSRGLRLARAGPRVPAAPS